MNDQEKKKRAQFTISIQKSNAMSHFTNKEREIEWKSMNTWEMQYLEYRLIAGNIC